MKNFKYTPALLLVIASAIAIAGVWLFTNWRSKPARERRPIASFVTAKPVLEAHAGELPAELKGPNEGKWKAWAEREDNVVRTRLEQGALDSMINLLLFGTSFTAQPRVITMNDFADPVVQARVTDLVKALRNPGNNERIIFLRNLLRSRGVDPDNSASSDQTKNFVLENLRRVVQEQNTIRNEVDQAGRESNQETGLSERSRVFRDRGISVDTTILSSFGIDGALRDMADRGVLSKGSITRVGVIGPGLDFTDKGFGYDFYPLQTLQPFAVYDSLVRSGLGQRGKIEVTAFDISQEVLEHLRRSRERAEKGDNYVVQLPRESWPWAPEAVEYWRTFGSEIGAPVAPIEPPPALTGLETRAVAVRPDVVLSCKPVDLNIVLEELDRSAEGQFDLIIATNVLIYYDTFEQALALRNIATLLKPGGFFLTNDWLPQVSQIPMRSTGYTAVRYGESGDWGDNVVWWRRD